VAGDWVKIEKTTARKPEVLRIANLLGVHPDHAFGLCIRFWVWVDDHMKTCNAPSVTASDVDVILERPGFSDALLSVGWLRVRDGSLEVPNFDRHLSQKAKDSALSAARVKKHRAGNNARASPVDGNADVTVEALQGERAPICINSSSSSSSSFKKPSLEEIEQYCAQRGNQVDPQAWLDHYEANGWKVGRNAMKDWRASVRTWERNAKSVTSNFHKPKVCEGI